MGIFSGYLILSDLDDTFRGNEHSIREHSKAIRYFTENGGRFSFATGRGASHIQSQAFFSLVNAPGCMFNGSYIYDFPTDTYLRRSYLDFTAGDFADMLTALDVPLSQLHVPTEPFLSVNKDDLAHLPPEIRSFRAMKLVTVFGSPELAERYLSILSAQPLVSSCYASRSWDVGIEFTPADATKGTALDFIKHHLGDIHTAVGVGNYYNDIPLLQHADIGVAVANAPQEVQRSADLVVPACNDFGLCALIDYLKCR